ncbi:alpha/beta fold hydrolase [Gephyromycinifex aptenodytis]|uniref:alpha/beta fold hydrolase n=1 Tax=Gephyromycinifex aptenodytis TaxID=2716227 RepID=UPI0014485E8B|nr:alpha/beta hydrolase [Gephyromycinifex aptenodytis]
MTEHTQGRAVWVPTRDGRRLYSQVLDGPQDAAVTVVFEAGAAASRSPWSLVQTRVAQFARAVVYDRAGLGKSPADPAGRTLNRMAQDLHDVLDHYGPGPFVLVGHSAGGPIVRLAASLRPDQVIGLVLLDPADEGVGALFSPAFRAAEQISISITRVLARTGRLQRSYGWLVEAMPAADVREDLQREGFTPAMVDTHAAQARTFLDELAAWVDDPPELGQIPVSIISGRRTGDGMNARLRAAVNAAHAARASSSPGGRYVLALNSGHYVLTTDPDLVAQEIRRFVTAG